MGATQAGHTFDGGCRPRLLVQHPIQIGGWRKESDEQHRLSLRVNKAEIRRVVHRIRLIGDRPRFSRDQHFGRHFQKFGKDAPAPFAMDGGQFGIVLIDGLRPFLPTGAKALLRLGIDGLQPLREDAVQDSNCQKRSRDIDQRKPVRMF